MIRNSELRRRIAMATHINKSDIDYCEHKGRPIINFSWGDPQGNGFLAEAACGEEQFLRGSFPAEKQSDGV
jgi:hypothetical protein